MLPFSVLQCVSFPILFNSSKIRKPTAEEKSPTVTAKNLKESSTPVQVAAWLGIQKCVGKIKLDVMAADQICNFYYWFHQNKITVLKFHFYSKASKALTSWTCDQKWQVIFGKWVFDYATQIACRELHVYMSVLENSQKCSKHSSQPQFWSSASK